MIYKDLLKINSRAVARLASNESSTLLANPEEIWKRAAVHLG